MPFDLMAGWQNDLAPHWIGKDVKDYKLIEKNFHLEKNPLYKQKKKEKINKDMSHMKFRGRQGKGNRT
jgi:hypothetical protein